MNDHPCRTARLRMLRELSWCKRREGNQRRSVDAFARMFVALADIDQDATAGGLREELRKRTHVDRRGRELQQWSALAGWAE